MSIELSHASLENSPESAFRAKEQIKVLMALREAEYGDSDVTFIYSNGSKSRLADTVSQWLSSPKNCHDAKLTLVARPSLAVDGLKNHPKLTEVSIREGLSLSEFDEAIVVGKEVVIINIDGDVSFVRRKDLVDGAGKIIRALRRISALEKAKGI